MSGKRIAALVLALVTAVVIGGGAIVWSLLQVPDFYQQALAEQQDPRTRREAAREFIEQTVRLAADIRNSDRWSEEFTQAQVNAWLAEELHQNYAELVPEGVRDPRVRLSDGAIQVGFRYEQADWKGVVSVKLRPWVVEPNTLAIEVDSIHAGLLPIPLETVLEHVWKQFESDGWHAEWNQHNGNDVLVVRFESADEDKPILEQVRVADGALQISGGQKARESAAPDGPREVQQFPTAERTAEEMRR